jgi:hypothetical protein
MGIAGVLRKRDDGAAALRDQTEFAHAVGAQEACDVARRRPSPEEPEMNAVRGQALVKLPQRFLVRRQQRAKTHGRAVPEDHIAISRRYCEEVCSHIRRRRLMGTVVRSPRGAFLRQVVSRKAPRWVCSISHTREGLPAGSTEHRKNHRPKRVFPQCPNDARIARETHSGVRLVTRRRFQAFRR